jgi:hypothetical protein
MAASFVKRRRREDAARKIAEVAAQKELERREKEMVAPWINTAQPKKEKVVAQVTPALKPTPVVVAKVVEEPEEVVEVVVEVAVEAKAEDEELVVAESIDLSTLRKSELAVMVTEQGSSPKGLTKGQLIKLLEG